MEVEAFYERLDELRFRPTPHTRGPWSPDAQHGGPPAALLGHVLEGRPGAREDMRVARLTFELLRPVPVLPLAVSLRVLRAGRSTELVEAALTPEGGGAEVMRMTALRIRTAPRSVPAVAPPSGLPGPETAEPVTKGIVPWEQGYHTGMELRFTAGDFTDPGPAACWFRLRLPLVAGEETTPLSRVLAAADSGNGISNELDYASYRYVNPDLTVHLHRYPVGDWVALDSRTSTDADGIGLADTLLHDEKGPIGRSVQSLFLAPR